jgi:hypothetical protein
MKNTNTQKIIICIILTLVSSVRLLAQDISPIATDRPDQTEASYLTPKGWLQIETGALIDNQNENIADIIYNTTLIRYGLADNFELRLLQDYLGTSVNNTIMNKGFSPFGFGAKIGIVNEHGWIPETALIGHLFLKTGHKAHKANSINPEFRFSFAHTLPNEFALSYNLGAEWDGNNTDATAIYTLSIARSVIGNCSAFVELYGFLPENTAADHRFDAGVTYLIGNDLQFDFSVGIGLNDVAPDNFISLGVSWRFNTRK